ncbi:MAG: exodeoxyribonuclease VII large subunit [Bdellovibrionales bacterium]|jgi:exodeoxyribonuclease VII large subunit
MPKKTTQAPEDDLLSRTLVDTPREGRNVPEWTVSDLSRQLKRMVEDGFGHVRVRGEIGECKLHSSGHLYLSLKDDNAVLAAVCWKGQVAKLGLKPATGMDVVCTGKLTTYAGQSKYQMNVESMALAGVGALLKMLEERRVKLAAEGLFDESRKKKLPFLPRVIGVVTSPTGAVIRDILHRLEERFPRPVLVWPVPVQGEGAAEKIAAAIRGFNALEEGGATPRPDVLIVARGGGSLEDLMPFNEEVVVRAVAESRIPVISAVGHETDTTLVDYAADLRAPTPTAAAEKAVPVRAELMESLGAAGLRLHSAMRRALLTRKDSVELLARALGDPMRALRPLMQRLDERADRLTVAWGSYYRRLQARVAEAGGRLRHPRDVVHLAVQRLEAITQRMNALARERVLQAEKKLDRLGAMLEALSPRAVLGRGYGLIYDSAGRVMTSIAALKKDDTIRIELHDGSRKARVED